jgi:hypothetical protein
MYYFLMFQKVCEVCAWILCVKTERWIFLYMYYFSMFSEVREVHDWILRLCRTAAAAWVQENTPSPAINPRSLK